MSESHSSRQAFADEDLPRFIAKLRSGKPILFRPRGRSMQPFLGDGTVVMVEPLDRPPALFDVVLAVLDDHLVLHRVMHTSADAVWLMGDAHRHFEGPLPFARIVGRARLDVPRGAQALRMKWRRAMFVLLMLGRR